MKGKYNNLEILPTICVYVLKLNINAVVNLVCTFWVLINFREYRSSILYNIEVLTWIMQVLLNRFM